MSDRPNEITPEMIFRVAELHRTIKEQVGEIERLTRQVQAYEARVAAGEEIWCAGDRRD